MENTKLLAKISEDFWFNKLKGMDNVIPHDANAYIPHSNNRAVHVFRSVFSSQAMAALQDKSQGKALNKYKLFISGYAIVLSYYFKGKKFAIGTTSFSFADVNETELP